MAIKSLLRVYLTLSLIFILSLSQVPHAAAVDVNEANITTANSLVYFSGTNIKERANYSYAGIVYALNGDLSREGLLLRGVFGLGEYEYDTLGVVGGEVEGDLTQFDITIGYQMYRDQTRLSGYIGVNYQDHDLDPQDLANSTRGDELGLIVQAEIETTLSHSLLASIITNFSTANDSYWSRVRLGRKFDRFTIGPEFLAMGNEEYDGQRYGVFINGIDLGFANIGVSGGFADVNGTQGDSSAYGSIGFSKTF